MLLLMNHWARFVRLTAVGVRGVGAHAFFEQRLDRPQVAGVRGAGERLRLEHTHARAHDGVCQRVGLERDRRVRRRGRRDLFGRRDLL